LCALLEDHAPTWFTEQQRGRALGTLEALGLLELEGSKATITNCKKND
jgi:hypothetical protein